MYLPLAAVDGADPHADDRRPEECGARTAAEKAGATFEVATPDAVDDRDDQAAAVDEALDTIIATAPTAVVVDASTSGAELSPAALRAARDAGIRIVVIGSGDEKQVAGVIFQETTPPAAPVIDRIAAEHPRGQVLVVTWDDPGDQHHLKDAFDAHSGLTPVVRTVGFQEPPADQQRRIQADLASNQRITAVVAENAVTAAAARAAIAATDSAARVDLWALGGYQDIPDAVAAGTMSGFVTTTPATLGAQAVKVALGSRTGVQVDVPALLITEKSLPQFRRAATC